MDGIVKKMFYKISLNNYSVLKVKTLKNKIKNMRKRLLKY